MLTQFKQLDPVKVAVVILIAGAAFVAMHGVSHSFSTSGGCTFCNWMAK
jgi:hypothetical protein